MTGRDDGFGQREGYGDVESRSGGFHASQVVMIVFAKFE